MKKFYLCALGCKVNSYEANAIKDELINNGYEQSLEKDADFIIVNTCCVTNTAASKSRQKISSLSKINPKAKIIVMGCYIQGFKDEVINMPNVYLYIGTNNRSKIIEYINKLDEKTSIVEDISKFDKYEELSLSNTSENTRAYLKIEDGCENFCSYCIIPYVRGKVKSRNKDNVINEAKHLIALGYKEIVLTGISTGSYGKDLDGYTFSMLVKELLSIEGLYRLRISSIEESEIDDEFIKLLKENDKLAKHIHLPLQAGSDHVLKLMNRHYNRDAYLSLINKIKSEVKDIAFTTDVIVGFPDESESDFNDTLDLCKKAGFSKIHVFPFSARKGTAAAKMKNQINGTVKKDRVNRLISLSNELGLSYNKEFVNKEVLVLIEEKVDNYYVGHTTNFLKVMIKSNKDLERNSVVSVIIKEALETHLIASLEDK